MESSLTEMDWLGRLNVGGALAELASDHTADPLGSQREQDCDDPYSSKCSGENGTHSGTSKPPYSYTHLITSAINSSPIKRMALSEIYQWIADNFPYYQSAGPGWKVRIYYVVDFHLGHSL